MTSCFCIKGEHKSSQYCTPINTHVDYELVALLMHRFGAHAAFAFVFQHLPKTQKLHIPQFETSIATLRPSNISYTDLPPTQFSHAATSSRMISIWTYSIFRCHTQTPVGPNLNNCFVFQALSTLSGI